jgi:hypothetical protein
MSPSYLFTAQNKDGNSVTERVEAENLSAARYKLEIQGYTCIQFHQSEFSNDIYNLFDEHQIKNAKKHPPKQMIALQYKTGWHYTILNALKATAIFWIPMLMWAIYSQKSLPIFALTIFGGILLYCIMPALIYHQFITNHFWANSKQVRFWGSVAKLFNLISINKLPEFELDAKLACADAREENLNEGLRRIAKYQNNPKVSKRLLNVSIAGVYTAAKKYDEVLSVRENSLREGNIFPEELIDYAVTLAAHHKKTSQAREVINRVMDMELNVLGKVFLPYCQGIIETEDGNLPKAEFYLRDALNQLKPFEKNSHLDGLRCLVKSFLSISLGNQGDKQEAEQLFREAKPFLIAQKETELLQRCEEAVA